MPIDSLFVLLADFENTAPQLCLQKRRDGLLCKLLACGLDHIELQITAYHHAISRQAELTNTLGVLLRLHQREIDVVNDAPDKRPNPSVTAERRIGDAAIDY